MRKFERFLFVWNIVVITVLLVLWGFKSPSLLNFISILFLLPSFFYFWIRLSSPESANFPYWTKRIVLLIIFLVSLILISAYAKSTNKQKELESQLNESQETITKLKADIKDIDETRAENLKLQEEIASLKDEIRDVKVDNTTTQITEEITDVLSDTISFGTLSVKDSQELDVLEKPVSGSRRVGTIVKGETYAYSNSENDWYQIELDAGITGWVREEDVIASEN